MISCSYRKDVGLITIDGHAGYAPKGQDIVCAGVSAIEVALAEWLKAENIPHKAVIGEETDCILCKDARAEACMDMAWTGLKLIAENYPDYVCIGG